MNDARVDQIEETLRQLNDKVDGISTQLKSCATHDDLKAFATCDDLKAFATHEDLKAGFAKAFEQTQGGFEDHRAFTEFVVERSAKILRTEMNRRFDGMEERFDRLEKLIKGA